MRASRGHGPSTAPSQRLYPRSRSPTSAFHWEGQGLVIKVRLLGRQGPGSVGVVDETCFLLAVVQGRVTSVLPLDQTGPDALELHSRRISSSKPPVQQPGQHCEEHLQAEERVSTKTLRGERDWCVQAQNGNQCDQTMGNRENNKTENQARTRLCNILETTVRNLHYLLVDLGSCWRV